ncbi:hypothetical protein BOTBODRAFT_27035 [Botryobasidium botryosum FD-172 SS1]|uniref:AAA+ ATPase domain-containing protein n=1 Tax=Botryobasidium botryosum (strain FD-172 SS1) TaxID=930990 RepID=A0A067N231_BOTB1|nr:hypothetical protein BOTBODRAFT_27035 [Botryobasidium botryosum FD-172 SS1]
MAEKRKPSAKGRSKSKGSGSAGQAKISSFYRKVHTDGGAVESEAAISAPATPGTPARKRALETADEDVSSPSEDEAWAASNRASPLLKGKKLKSIYDLPIPKRPRSKSSSRREGAHPFGGISGHSAPRASREKSIIIIDDETTDVVAGISSSATTPPSGSQKALPNKAVHPFFRRSTNLSAGSAESPIHVTSSPVKVDLYQSAPSKITGAKRLRPDDRKHESAPWPSRELFHVRGPQSVFASPVSRFPRIIRLTQNSGSGVSKSWCMADPPRGRLRTTARIKRVCVVDSSSELDAHISTIPTEHLSHPAISRMLDHARKPHSLQANNADPWTEAWKPACAAEVLGNEENADFLKAWLLALGASLDAAVGEPVKDHAPKGAKPGNRAKKRHAVVRTAEKQRKRKRQREDDYAGEDWVVDDEWDDEANTPSASQTSQGVASSSQLDPGGSTQTSTLSDDYTYDFSHCLTNAMLLMGPSGSGKTAAVYACAQELGWDVHEVNPGMKRTGPALAAIAEGVGKNHVLPDRQTIGKSGQLVSQKVGGLAAGTVTVEGTLMDEPIDIDGCRPGPSRGDSVELIARAEVDLAETANHDKSRVKQSIILLEEVDILFKDDVNFWPAVVGLIKDSRRPVIMTCNDPFLVPAEELPLQSELAFQPCPPSLATSYLQCLCLAHGRLMPRQDLWDLYQESTYQPLEADLEDIPIHPLPYQALATPDLRRSIVQAQYLCQISPTVEDGVGRDGNGELDDMKGSTLTVDGANPIESLSDWSVGSSPPAASCPTTSMPPAALGNQERQVSEARELRSLSRFMDSVSLMNASLEQRPLDQLEAMAIDRYEPSADDELGYCGLLKPAPDEFRCGLAFYNSDDEMALEAAYMARRVYEETGLGGQVQASMDGSALVPFSTRTLYERRRAYQFQVVQFLDPHIAIDSPLLPRPAQVLDYVPYIRALVEADNVLAALHESSRASAQRGVIVRSHGRRAARACQRYYRYLTLDEDQLRAVAESGFQTG